MKGFTPQNIQALQNNEVFVFGSNEAGRHLGGAAYAAYKLFGAQMGKGVGIQGQSYAIPTLGGDMQKLSVAEIGVYVDELYTFALNNPQLDFYMTLIGCGIAGFKAEELKHLFVGLSTLPNMYLPKEFVD